MMPNIRSTRGMLILYNCAKRASAWERNYHGYFEELAHTIPLFRGSAREFLLTAQEGLIQHFFQEDTNAPQQ